MTLWVDKLPERNTRNRREYKSVIINQIPEERWYQIVFVADSAEHQLVEIFELPEDSDRHEDCFLDLEEAVKKVRMLNSKLRRNGVEFIDL